jgi:hypothetical protein
MEHVHSIILKKIGDKYLNYFDERCIYFQILKEMTLKK